MLTPGILYAKEFTFDKSSSIKQTIYQKLRNSNGNTFSFIPHVCYFSYHPSIAASKAWSLTTIFSIKMRGRKHRHKNTNFQFHSSCMLFFISPQYCCFQSLEFNKNLLYQNEGEETQSQEHQHPCPILLKFHHSSPPFFAFIT